MIIIKRKCCCFAFLCLLTAMLITACGRDAALDEYKNSMEQFYDSLADINFRMNSIDETSDTASEDMLALLDELNTLTYDMAQVEVPEKFRLVESLADEASENMSNAVELYHQLYSSDEYNESVADGAYEYYERANRRLNYIKSILHGNTPEELVVQDGTETED